MGEGHKSWGQRAATGGYNSKTVPQIPGPLVCTTPLNIMKESPRLCWIVSELGWERELLLWDSKKKVVRLGGNPLASGGGV